MPWLEVDIAIESKKANGAELLYKRCGSRAIVYETTSSHTPPFNNETAMTTVDTNDTGPGLSASGSLARCSKPAGRCRRRPCASTESSSSRRCLLRRLSASRTPASGTGRDVGQRHEWIRSTTPHPGLVGWSSTQREGSRAEWKSKSQRSLEETVMGEAIMSVRHPHMLAYLWLTFDG